MRDGVNGWIVEQAGLKVQLGVENPVLKLDMLRHKAHAAANARAHQPACDGSSGPSDQTTRWHFATLSDIETANRVANEVLGRAVDDLPPQTRTLLNIIDDMVTKACHKEGVDRADYRFSRRDVREHAGWGNTQLKVHLKRLEELEYLLVHRGGRGQSFVYELLYEAHADDGQRFLARLIDVDNLRRDQSGTNGNKPVESRPQVGGKSGRSRSRKHEANPANNGTIA